MNFIRTFESRVSDAFGAAPQGYTAPFSFKRLAKLVAKELEAETYVIDGVDTAPALYTVLVSSVDDTAMRLLYPQLTQEIVSFVEAEAKHKQYVFVGEPLARFIVDNKLRAGKFAVFAENVDAVTLEHLRDEEIAFLSGSSAVGGAAADLSAARPARSERPVLGALARRRARQQAAPAPAAAPTPARPAATQQPSLETLPSVDPETDDSAAMGLDIVPVDLLDDQLRAAAFEPQAPRQEIGVMTSVPAAPAVEGEPQPAVPLTQRRTSTAGSTGPIVLEDPSADEPATCLLVDRQSGRTYMGVAPVTGIGRARLTGNIVLRDPNVSRRHAELVFDEATATWSIRDLGSTNGTMVNNVEVTNCALRDGDLVTVGLMNLEFREG